AECLRFTGVGLALIPDDAADGVRRERCDHAVVQRCRSVGIPRWLGAGLGAFPFIENVFQSGVGLERFAAGPRLRGRAAPIGFNETYGNVKRLVKLTAEEVFDGGETCDGLRAANLP